MRQPSTRTKTLALFLLAALLTGCRSTLCLYSRDAVEPIPPDPRPVYVTNPDLTREYEILKAAGIYRLSYHSADARLLTLKRLRQSARCANPLLLSALTLGVIPGWLPGYYAFEYEIEMDGAVQCRTHALPVYERLSIWEWLVRRDNDKVLAKALAHSSAEHLSAP